MNKNKQGNEWKRYGLGLFQYWKGYDIKVQGYGIKVWFTIVTPNNLFTQAFVLSEHVSSGKPGPNSMKTLISLSPVPLKKAFYALGEDSFLRLGNPNPFPLPLPPSRSPG